NRLPYLSDGPPLEREVRRPQDRLLADEDRAEPERAIAVELRVRRAEHGEPPAVGPHERAELGQERVQLVLVPDRVAAHERGSGDDAIGEECTSRRREEVALVAPEREEGQAVAPVRV